MRHSIRNAKELLCAVRNSDLTFHELPAKEQLRDAWLRHISQQGIDKGSQWVPNSRAIVCSIHFKEDNYKVGLKRKVLRPPALLTQFLPYPVYMLLAASNKRRSVVHVAPATAKLK
ncbi:hypothetical protein HPB49_011188 [Dermacentor silvarum]|uniref:Uncharacterized protein n=1 Tax=Dermacentor silvarum TaxID=543639 RepID=A0ACB8DZP3_DERSI|nr:hypothetical protein HPB49_011188 [Dermacentor silvarum]